MNFIAKCRAFLVSAGSATKRFAIRHKIVSTIIVLIILGIGYASYSALAAGKAATQYALAATTEGPLQVTITGSGQVTSNDTLNLSPKASGQITDIYVTAGQTVKAGQIIAEVDMTDAAQTVTTAKENLLSAQISYQQSVTSSQNTTTNNQTSVQTSQTSAANTVSTVYSGLPAVMTGFDSALHSLSTMPGYSAQQNIDAYANYVNSAQTAQYRDQTSRDYQAAVTAYQAAQAENTPTNLSTVAGTEEVLENTANATKAIALALNDALTYYNYINTQTTAAKITIPPGLTSQLSSLNSYLSTVNGDTSSLTSADSSLTSAQQSLAQSTQTLSGSSMSLDMQSAQLNLQKAQDALAQAEQDESDYIVRAPFDGTIATVPAHIYDQASSGTAVATLITTGNYVDLSINEADIAKIQVGQQATLTFDAIDGLTANGTVAEVDPVGTVSQGVVTYTVKVGLTTEDSRIKPGMTADATIVTSSVADAIQVPSAAVHTANGQSYVEVATLKNASSTAMAGGARTGSSTRAYGSYGTASSTRRFTMGSTTRSTASSTGSTSAFAAAFSSRAMTVPEDDVTIMRVPVVTGISNDTMVQVESGLKPGQLVVTSTVAAAAKSGGLFGLFGSKAATTGAARTTTGTAARAGALGGSAGFTGGGGATFRTSGSGASAAGFTRGG